MATLLTDRRDGEHQRLLSSIRTGWTDDPLFRMVVGIGCILAPLRVPTLPITLGALFAVFLLPVCISAVKSRQMIVFGALAVVGVAVGYLILPPLSIEAEPGRHYDSALALHQLLLVVSALLTYVFLNYCFSIVGGRSGVALAGVGLVGAVFYSSNSAEENPWKYGGGVAISILLLAIISKRGTGLQASACILLALVSAVYESRSLALVLLATALVIFFAGYWRDRAIPFTPVRGVQVVTALALVGWIAVSAVNAAALSGKFGADLASRQREQLANGGLLGGRTEYGAFLNLVREIPIGFGFGIGPSLEDSLDGRAGMRMVGGGGGGAYVDERMFGDWVELHSIVGDLWVQLGIAGLVLGVGVLIFLVRAVWWAAVARIAPLGLALFLGINGIWDLLFSPLYANLVLVAVSVAALVSLMRDSGSGVPPAGGARVMR